MKMKPPDHKITLLSPGSALPFDLLLLADETAEAIEKYIHESDVYMVCKVGRSQPVAVFALYKVDDVEVEIKNIAVAEALQGQSIGSYLVGEIKGIARAQNFRRIIVGTTDQGLREIRFYERNGFKRYGIRKDFFVENYPEPIYENGTRLRDMVMLAFDL